MKREFLSVELERLKNKHGIETDVRSSIKNIASLFSQGTITKGIEINDIGWFTTLPTPEKEIIQSELDEIVKIIGVADAGFLLLAKQCNLYIPEVPTIFTTKDANLFNIVNAHDVPAYFFQGFPLTDVPKITKELASITVDWDKELEEIQQTIKQHSVIVDLTLTPKRDPPHWLQGKVANYHILMAEGHGVVNLAENKIHFNWYLPFKPWILDVQSLKQQAAPDILDIAQINFLSSEEGISSDITN